ncbi:MAG TPA: amino acid adenylation domain-containing protein [Pseudonocardiaceae bacterium]|nr:amino acid adenylation domain-containing protein [Pseudonocardiaceae bacterium]
MADAGATSGAYDIAGLSPQRQALLALELARRHTATAGVPRQERQGAEPTFPLSYGQERLWFLDQADPGSTAYVMSGGLRLRGVLDLAALRAALTEIVRRHEVLRTTFPAEGGRPTQRIGPVRPIALPVQDIRAADVDRELAADAGRPFDLLRDPLLRARLLRCAAEDHVLVLSMHHIASDGWSLGVLVHEVSVLYEAFARARPTPLPELAVQYADYAVWQRDWLARGRMDEQLAYWQERLADVTAIELPADRARSDVRGWHGSSVPLTIPAALYRDVATLGGRSGATPYMVLLAVFAVVLARWSGQPDVLIGSPVAGRRHPELEPLVGFFVNTLPIRVDTSGRPSFADLLARVRATCDGAYGHQDVPFEKVVAAVQPDRAGAAVPLVQVMLALRDVPMARPSLPGLDVTVLDPSVSQSTKFDLAVDLVPAPEGTVAGRVEFSTDLFDAATASRIAEAFLLALTTVVGDPGRCVDEVPLFAAERDWVLGALSGTGGVGAAGTTDLLHQLIDRQAEARPGSTAVRCGGFGLTYRELITRANRLASHLRTLGAGPERLVGVCLPRSADIVVALVAILKAGAGYVPLDPAYPRDRVAMMVGDSGVSVVVTDRRIADTGLLPVDGIVLTNDDPAGDDEPPVELCGPRSLCYVIYTSGSSGVPKGSANEHGGVANTLLGLNTTLGLTPTDRMLAISSLNYDMSVYEIFGTLLAGACVVVCRDDEVTDPELLRTLVLDEGVTAWSSAPALLRLLVDHAHEHGGLPGCRLRLATLGGDRLSPALADRLHELVPDVRLYNLAGMTEVSYCSTYHLVRRPEPVPGRIPWGRPLPNQRLYVLDDRGEPVPVGVRGELFIGGAGVRRGYWRRPALTARRFVPDPFGPDPGGRLYRTGDAARWRVSGELEFLGRLDNQVKLRGLRIELGEVEHALGRHPQVREAVVVLRTDGAGARLVGYVSTRGPLPPSTGELRQHLLGRLPEYMVPSAFVLLDSFPLLPSGKLDRDALPEPAGVRSEMDGEYVEPVAPLDVVLAGIWADVLDVDRVGVTDEFFQLGGHSLLVTQVVSRIKDLFRVTLSVRDFLAAGTITGLASTLRAEAAGNGGDVDRTARLVLEVGAMDESQVRGRLADELR